MNNITVAITAIPPRQFDMLPIALRSVTQQTRSPEAIVVAMDTEKRGAPYTRDRATQMVNTKWIAYLDDDDQLLPFHLEILMNHALKTDADLVFPWFSVIGGGTDPWPELFGKPWDDKNPHQIPVTFLAKTEIIQSVGGFTYEWDETQGEDPGLDPDGNRAGEDYRMILRLVKQDAKIVHLPERTWLWNHHSSNSSGLPSRVKWT